jgi:hypothetical protein
MKALLIPVEGDIEIVEQNGLDDLQKLVGGCIETVTPPKEREDIALYFNEEGKLLAPPLPNNPRATLWMAGMLMPGDYIGGPLVITGFDAKTGDNTDVPDDLKDELEALPV